MVYAIFGEAAIYLAIASFMIVFYRDKRLSAVKNYHFS